MNLQNALQIANASVAYPVRKHALHAANVYYAAPAHLIVLAASVVHRHPYVRRVANVLNAARANLAHQVASV